VYGQIQAPALGRQPVLGRLVEHFDGYQWDREVAQPGQQAV
jgi:hypothetical protein